MEPIQFFIIGILAIVALVLLAEPETLEEQAERLEKDSRNAHRLD